MGSSYCWKRSRNSSFIPCYPYGTPQMQITGDQIFWVSADTALVFNGKAQLQLDRQLWSKSNFLDPCIVDCVGSRRNSYCYSTSTCQRNWSSYGKLNRWEHGLPQLHSVLVVFILRWIILTLLFWVVLDMLLRKRHCQSSIQLWEPLILLILLHKFPRSIPSLWTLPCRAAGDDVLNCRHFVSMHPEKMLKEFYILNKLNNLRDIHCLYNRYIYSILSLLAITALHYKFREQTILIWLITIISLQRLSCTEALWMWPSMCSPLKEA